MSTLSACQGPFRGILSSKPPAQYPATIFREDATRSLPSIGPLFQGIGGKAAIQQGILQLKSPTKGWCTASAVMQDAALSMFPKETTAVFSTGLLVLYAVVAFYLWKLVRLVRY